MSDFRTNLYGKHSSHMHAAKEKADARYLKSYFGWVEHKMSPLLSNLRPDARILDLGCGQGHFLAYLKQKGFTDIRGIDVCEELVEVARATGLEVECADVFEYLDGLQEKFDLVVAIDFLEHLTRDELVRLMPMIHRVLKPGGYVLFQTPNGEGLFPRHVIYGDLTHMTVLTPRSLRQLLSASGFTNAKFSECGPAPKNVQGMIRVALWKGIRTVARAVRMVEVGASHNIWTENMICVAEADRTSE